MRSQGLVGSLFLCLHGLLSFTRAHVTDRIQAGGNPCRECESDEKEPHCRRGYRGWPRHVSRHDFKRPEGLPSSGLWICKFFHISGIGNSGWVLTSPGQKRWTGKDVTSAAAARVIAILCTGRGLGTRTDAATSACRVPVWLPGFVFRVDRYRCAILQPTEMRRTTMRWRDLVRERHGRVAPER